LPGGFSFGDYLGSGTVFALYLSQIKEHLIKFIEEEKIILGICNGFQILIRAGLLPNWKEKKIQASLTFNKSSKFEARWVKLRIVSKKYDYIKMMPKKYIHLPVAHGEGRFVTSEKKMIDRLYENNQVLFEYAESRYPSNPNGSERNIAGITSPEGHIIGMMPHPERFYTPYLFPNWQNNQNNQHPDGLLFIKAVVDHVKKTLN
jgi:phosphoribosylformylglycinamidine synthase subunit PurQ / glutaminase